MPCAVVRIRRNILLSPLRVIGPEDGGHPPSITYPVTSPLWGARTSATVLPQTRPLLHTKRNILAITFKAGVRKVSSPDAYR